MADKAIKQVPEDNNSVSKGKVGYETSPLLQSMYDYSIVPSDFIKKRMDFFYTPYNQNVLLRKHMTFDDEGLEPVDGDLNRAVTPQPMRMHCIDIEAKGMTIQADPDDEDKQEQKQSLRVFSKADIPKLTKRKWIEVKDLIFETDKNVLQGIRYDMIRWRKADNLQLNKDYAGSRFSNSANRSRRTAVRNTIVSPITPPLMNQQSSMQSTGGPKRKTIASMPASK